MGKEMKPTGEADGSFSFQPVDSIKRKFNIAKVAGSATNLKYIKHKDRVFEERELLP
jgi:antitoxin VapB